MDDGKITRRDFVSSTVGAGIVAAAGTPVSAQARVVETNVEIKTPDGTCDAAFIHPADRRASGGASSGPTPSVCDPRCATWPGVWPPRDIRSWCRIPSIGSAKRLLRTPRSSTSRPGAAKLTPLMGSINADGAVEKDATAFVAWLDAQHAIDKTKKIGTQGYCMGGALVVQNRGGGAESHRRRRVLSRRRPGDRESQQSASAGAEDQGADVLRRSPQRRHAAAGCQGRS